jgi:predicted RNA-binding protein with PIN domain
MKYLVDGYNLIFQLEQCAEALHAQGPRGGREALCAWLRGFSTRDGVEALVLVFDGGEAGAHRPAYQREGSLELVFSGPGLEDTADRKLLEVLARERRPGQWTVVSDDKFVRREAQRLGSKLAGCLEFMRVVHAWRQGGGAQAETLDRRKQRGLHASEVQGWVDFFQHYEKTKPTQASTQTNQAEAFAKKEQRRRLEDGLVVDWDGVDLDGLVDP